MVEISLIIPVYNAQKTLKDCLQSIFNQTFKDFEIIAVNDGSTDQSAKILNQLADKISIINQVNQGAAAARNAGAKKATGEYIIFCDADVIMAPTMLEKMRQALLDQPSAAYIYSAFKYGQKIFRLWPFDPYRLKQMPYIHTTSLIRRNHFVGFDTGLKRFQDWDLWLTMMEKGDHGYYLPEILFSVQAGGTMSHWLPKFAYRLPWLKKVKQYLAAEKIIKTKHQL